MMNILIVEDDPLIVEMMELFLHEEYGATIITKTSAQEAILYFSQDTQIDLIISDYNMPNGCGGDLYIFIKNNFSHIPFVLVTSDPLEIHPEFATFTKDNSRNCYLQKPWNFDQLIGIITQFTGEQNKQSEQIAIDFTLLKHIRLTPCALFLKLSDQKYIKIHEANQFITSDDLEKYQTKGVLAFYVERNEFKTLSNYLAKNIFSELTKISVTPEQRMTIQTDAVTTLHQLIRNNLALDNKTIEMIHDLNYSIIESLENEPSLIQLIGKLKRGQYIYQHSLLLSYVLCHLAKIMKIGTNDLYKSLCIAALLHDINFTDQELALEHDNPRQTFKYYASLRSFTQHPLDCETLIKKLKDIPEEVYHIVITHHERPDGTGYPQKLSGQDITQISALFIISEIFVNRLWVNHFSLSIVPNMLQTLERDFSHANFVKPIEALKKLLLLS